MNKPHKHAELIKAWADGAEIQTLNILSGKWEDIIPKWHEDKQYRIKPRPVLCRLYNRLDASKWTCLVQEDETARRAVLEKDSQVVWLTPWFNPEDIKEFK